ncbi:MAG TPA: endonuclease/exonuclease/phosphatase family protein [Kutzneria sp.]
MITVVTWNVLHRIHADNWGEEVAGSWPDEAKRVVAVAERVAELTEDVVALQEVSGDQLAALRETGRTVHAMRYPRMPRPRVTASPLKDNTEYLVLLVNGPSRELGAEAFPTDGGKGALAVDVQGLTVVATHVSWGNKRIDQVSRLARLAPPPAVLLGDFNADADTVLAALGESFRAAQLPAGTKTRGEQVIDHVIVHGATVTEAQVLNADGLSDHSPVRAAISW